MDFKCLYQKLKNIHKSIWTKKLPFFSCLEETQQQQNIIIRTIIRMKSNDRDTASRAMAQVGKDVPALSMLPIRLKREKKKLIYWCLPLSRVRKHWFCYPVSQILFSNNITMWPTTGGCHRPTSLERAQILNSLQDLPLQYLVLPINTAEYDSPCVHWLAPLPVFQGG